MNTTPTTTAREDLTSRAMIVSLNISQWTARKTDKRVSDQVARDNGASADAGKYNKSLVAREALENIAECVTAAREFHYAQTLPWLDSGARVLPAANFFSYRSQMNVFTHRFYGAVADFIGNYPAAVDEAKDRLGSMFSPADYPDSAKIANAFKMGVRFMPLPDSNDFRVQLSAEDTARVKADIEKDVRSATQTAMADLWKRIHDAVTHMADRLRKYSIDATTGKAANPFRDSLVENLRELVEILPRLNFTGDAKLSAMHQQIAAELTAIDAADLRTDANARGRVATAAEQILATMESRMAEFMVEVK